MSIQMGASVAIEISSKNASWVTMGILAGLIYGFYSSDENNSSGRMFGCAILGGTVMGLVGSAVVWAKDSDRFNDCCAENQPKTFHVYGT